MVHPLASLAVDRRRSGLKRKIGAAERPAHLPLLHEAPGRHGVHARLRRGRRDAPAGPASCAVIDYGPAIGPGVIVGLPEQRDRPLDLGRDGLAVVGQAADLARPVETFLERKLSSVGSATSSTMRHYLRPSLADGRSHPRAGSREHAPGVRTVPASGRPSPWRSRTSSCSRRSRRSTSPPRSSACSRARRGDGQARRRSRHGRAPPGMSDDRPEGRGRPVCRSPSGSEARPADRSATRGEGSTAPARATWRAPCRCP